MIKNNKKLINIIRIFIQILFIILLPTIFSYAFNGIKALISIISNGNFVYLTSLHKVGLALIIFTILFGRFFCGWICSFGAYNDFLYLIGKKIKKYNNIQIEKYDRHLKKLKYLILLAIVMLCITGNSSFINGKSPWDVFGQVISFRFRFTGFLIGIIIFAIITMGALFIERFFCRYICPFGAIFAIVDRLHFFELHKPSEKCGKCRRCTNECPMGISLYKGDEIKSGECIKCFRCTSICSRKNVKIKIFNKEVNKYVVSCAVILLIVILFFAIEILRF